MYATDNQGRHGIKQIDRLLSNQHINIEQSQKRWVPYVIGARKKIVVAMDWSEFDADGHSTIAINLTTSHGRATPLVWKSVKQSTLKDNRNRYEDELLEHFKACLPPDVHVILLADRGFCDTGLLASLTNKLGFDYVIRIRKNIKITNAKNEMRDAAANPGEALEHPEIVPKASNRWKIAKRVMSLLKSRARAGLRPRRIFGER